MGILFLDLDGTVRYNRHGKTFINSADDVAVYPEAVELMRAWNGPIVGITNQGGVGLGYMTHDQLQENIDRTGDLVDDLFCLVFACTHKPDLGCFCRKPAPGLLLFGVATLEHQGVEDVCMADCLMVGDRPEDEEAARRAGVPFMDAELWRAPA